MAYSRSEETLKKMLPELQNVSQGRTQKWSVVPGQAWWKASKIREALFIAREIFPNKYPTLALAAKSFTVEVLDSATVQARPTANTPATAIGDGEGPAPTEHPALDETPVHGLELASPPSVPHTVVGMKSATDIISFWLRAQPTNDKLVFTETRLSDTELNMLARWAALRTPAWMVVVAQAEGIVTLSPFQPGIPAWRAS